MHCATRLRFKLRMKAKRKQRY
ncbi:hypothetical protein ACLK1S_23035 [Escherichia coli]